MARKLVLVNDRALFRRWTGIGHYLAALIAHWPKQANVELLSACRVRPLNRAILPSTDRVPIEHIPPIRLEPLKALVPPASTVAQAVVGSDEADA